MATGGPFRLCQLPYPVLEELHKNMDTSEKWKELAGNYLGRSQDDIRYWEHREHYGFSPSRKVLTDWMNEDPSVDELFVILSKMRFYKAMLLIKDYVSPHLHPLLRGEGSKASFMDAVARRAPDKPKLGGQRGASAASGPRSPRSAGPQGAAAVTAADMNLNQNCTKEMMSTKLRADEVAALLDSRFGSKHEISTSSTVNNMSRPGAPLPAPGLVPVSGAAQLSSGSQWAAASGPAAAASAEPSDATPTAAVLGPPAGAPPSYPAPEVKIRNAPGEPDETEVKRKYSQDVCSYMDRLGNIPQIPYKELESGTDGWSQHRVLGSGGFGTVYRGSWKNTVWAIKRITQRDSSRTESEQQEQMRQTLEELCILNSCRHDNVLPLCGYSIYGPEPLLLYQFMDNGSLLDRIMCRRGSRPLSWLQRHNVARGTARGLQFLHTRGTAPLIHGDIKSANILLDHHLEPKIGDFGLAREFPETRHTSLTVTRVHGTRPYLPDEYLRSRRLSEKVDTYSFGVVLFELTTGLPAYDDKRQIKMLKTLVEETVDRAALMDRKGGSADVDIFPALLRVGELCVSRRAKDRPEMVRVLSELDCITQARNLAARAQRISVEEAPSVEMSPLELQVLMDRRQQGGASPRPALQPQRSGSPSGSALSGATAPPPYSEVVGYRYPQPWQHSPPHFSAMPSPVTPQLYNDGHSPHFQAALSPSPSSVFQPPATGTSRMQPPPWHAWPSPSSVFQPQAAGTCRAQPPPRQGPPSAQSWLTGEPALPTVLPHVLQRPSAELAAAIGGAEPQLGPAPLLTALGVKSGSQASNASVGDSQLSTDGSYVTQTATQ